MLLYTCELKAPLTDSFQQKKARVNEIIEELGLTGCRSVLIGHSLAKGISGVAPASGSPSPFPLPSPLVTCRSLCHPLSRDGLWHHPSSVPLDATSNVTDI